MAFVEISEQPWTSGPPSEQLASELRRGGAVESPEPAEKADIVARLRWADGDRRKVQVLR